MSRKLQSWAVESRSWNRPRLTWLSDVMELIGSRTGLRSVGAGSAPQDQTRRFSAATQPEKRRRGRQRPFDHAVTGLGMLEGLQLPAILAVSGSGYLDWPVLEAALPTQLQAKLGDASRTLGRGTTAVLFSDWPARGQDVGRFTPTCARLAKRFDAPVVPVALVGAHRLEELIALDPGIRPRVEVRFGSPIHVRNEELAEATARVQDAVEDLFRRGGAPAIAQPGGLSPWLRLWRQSRVTGGEPSPRIWPGSPAKR